MTGDQWYNIFRLAIWLGFTLLVLYGLYRLITSEERSNRDKD